MGKVYHVPFGSAGSCNETMVDNILLESLLQRTQLCILCTLLEKSFDFSQQHKFLLSFDCIIDLISVRFDFIVVT